MPTLDLSEKQILIDFFDDANGLIWHHRVLLAHVRDTTWVVCTPDLSVQRLDVAAHRLIMLPRAGAFPADRIQQIYGCDQADFTENVLTRLRSEALAMVEILGGAAVGGAAAAGAVAVATWRISDLSHDSFGEVVPPAAIADENVFVRREGTALVRLDNS